MENNYLTSQSFYWTVELVGTSQRLFFNLILFIISGFVCVRVTSYSAVMIFVLGGLFPVLLNYCLYKLFWETAKSSKFQISSFSVKLSKKKMKFMLAVDVVLILAFALAVGSEILHSSIFKIVACTIIPAIQVIGLRGMLLVYLS